MNAQRTKEDENKSKIIKIKSPLEIEHKKEIFKKRRIKSIKNANYVIQNIT